MLGEGNGTLPPYVSVMYADFKRLANPMAIFNIDINWLMKGYTVSSHWITRTAQYTIQLSIAIEFLLPEEAV